MRIALYYTTTMLLVTTIVTVAVLWCHLNHIRIAEGPLLFHLWGTHGVHLFDGVVLGVELMLVAVLTGTLIAGFAPER